MKIETKQLHVHFYVVILKVTINWNILKFYRIIIELFKYTFLMRETSQNTLDIAHRKSILHVFRVILFGKEGGEWRCNILTPLPYISMYVS